MLPQTFKAASKDTLDLSLSDNVPWEYLFDRFLEQNRASTNKSFFFFTIFFFLPFSQI